VTAAEGVEQAFRRQPSWSRRRKRRPEKNSKSPRMARWTAPSNGSHR